MNRLAALSVGMILAACGPNGHSTSELDGGGGGGDAYYGPVGSVHGTVWAPANAPGMVPAGHEIPISGALIWLSINPPDPIPQEVYCDQCVATTGASVYSDAKGNFTLGNVAPGNYAVEWINARDTADRRPAGNTTTGADLTSPTEGDDWLLRLRKR